MPKKRNTKRADGRIAVQVYVGRDENGKRKYKTVYGSTQKEADEKALAVKLAMRKGIDVTSEHETFATWAARWLAIKSGEVGRSQAEAYKHALKHLSPLDDLPIGKIKTIDVQEIVNSLADENPSTGRPSAPNTLRYIKITAQQVFRLAIENRVLDYNPAEAVKIPRTEHSFERRALTDEEQRWIIETDHRARTAAMIMMYAGLRRGELIPLLWTDVDLENRTISITKSAERVNGRFEVKDGAKSKSGVRTIIMPKVLTDYLFGLKRESMFVCPSASGKMHTESSWKKMWDSYIKELNFRYGDFSGFIRKPKSKFDPKGVPMVIPPITPHWLRHTYATMLYNAGVDVMTAKTLLGHADIKTTLGIYTHLDQRHKRLEVAKLDDFLSDASHMQVNDSQKPL